MEKCSPKGRDCIESKSRFTFNCLPSCDGIYADTEQWDYFDWSLEDMIEPLTSEYNDFKWNNIQHFRVVTLSSLGHAWTKNGIQFADLKWEKAPFDSMDAYNQSKLANILFTRELSIRTRGTGVTTYSLHPGTVFTDIGRNLRDKVPSWFQPVTDELAGYLFKSVDSGAQTTVFCCVDESLEDKSGRYWSTLVHNVGW